jgi:hypothetical protein
LWNTKQNICEDSNFKICKVLLCLIKFSWATSRVKWLKVDKTNVSRTISVLVLRGTEVSCNPVHVIYIYTPEPSVYSYALAHVDWWAESTAVDWITAHFSSPEDEDRDGPRNAGFIYF